MAIHAPAIPRKGLPAPRVTLLAVLALVAMVGVAFAAGRGSLDTRTSGTRPVQSSVGTEFTGMMPWMQTHMGDITWMRSHMGDVNWLKDHRNQWQWMRDHARDITWMQTHSAQWRWMQTHMVDIRWMHDNWGRWDRGRSGSGTKAWSGGGRNHQGDRHGAGERWHW